MKYLHIIDDKAPKWVEEVAQDLTRFYKPTGVEVEHKFDYRELKILPKEVYWGDYEGIAKWYLQALTAGIREEYGNSIDRVNLWITDEKWDLNGVWGWNMGVRYNGYDVHQCRIETRDSRNLTTKKANTFGTLYHEGMHANKHASDRYIFNGITVEKQVNNLLDLSEPVTDWQDNIVHGNHPDFDYIRFDNNQEALEAISTKLAYASIHNRMKEGIKDLSAIQRFLMEVMEQLVIINEKLGRKDEVMKPLTLEQQKELEKEYKKVIKSK